VNPGAEANQRAANGRAEACWLVYLSLGPGRSLSRLKRTLTDLGLEISLNTLKGYSVRHGWSDRARFHDEAHAVDDGALATTDMASRQADMGTAISYSYGLQSVHRGPRRSVPECERHRG
jgi:hypothetical protein